MMKVLGMAGLIVTLMVCSFSGCDDDDEIAGISKSEELKDLNEDELRDLCVYYAAELIDFGEKSCIVEGIAASALGGVDACESAVENCRDNIDEQYDSIDDFCGEDDDDGVFGDFDDPEEEDDGGADDMGSCDVTVGEAGACFDDLIQMGEDYMDGLECGDGVFDLLPEQIGVPESCVELMEKCPGIDIF